MSPEQTSWFEWIVAAVVSLMAWLGNRLHLRVDAIEASRAKNEELLAVKSEIANLRTHVDAKFDAQTAQIMAVMRDQR